MEKRKTALLLRMGGIGDCVILSPVARRLNELGYDVDFFVGSPNGNITEMFNLPYFKNVKETYRINGIDCVKNENGHFVSVEILKDNYDEVFDYKNSIEENHSYFFMKDEGWRHTINSNYVNWYDMMFAWTNIDPESIDSSYKRPEIHIPQKYLDFAKEIIPDGIKVIGIHLKASTLIRTWYRAGDLPVEIIKKYNDYAVLLYDGVRWLIISESGSKEIEVPDGYNPLLLSAALLTRMKVFISADSGYSHIAEFLEIPTIVIYTTVPAWTRMKYYKYTYPIEPDKNEVKCYPCFTLYIYCPIEMEKAKSNLNDREKDIFSTIQANQNNPAIVNELALKYNTMPYGIIEEYESIMRKLDAVSKTQPACVGNINKDKIMNLLDKLIKENVK